MVVITSKISAKISITIGTPPVADTESLAATGGSAVSFTVIDNVLELVVSELSLVAVHTKESTPLEFGLG